jgi:hypothetical protein
MKTCSIFMTYFYTKFHMPYSNGPLVNIARLKASETICMITISPFYILHKNVITKLHIFQLLFPHIISLSYINFYSQCVTTYTQLMLAIQCTPLNL